MAGRTFGFVTPETLELFTDLYELRMMEGYYEHGHVPEATFSLFFRRLPGDRGYMIAAGQEQVVEFIDAISFSDRALTFLEDRGFSAAFLETLAEFTFSGEVRAVPEGTPVFPNEPIIEVTAPLPEAQFIETLAINQIGFQSLVATKARRMRDVVDRYGDDETLVDFGSRRAHGTDAGIKAARAAYLGGFDGSSNVLAGDAFDVPTVGTMAHSWIQSFESERVAFEHFVESYGADSVLLIDTYDTMAGAELAREVAEDSGVDLRGIRLDSGDLVALSKQVDEVYPGVTKFISSGMDEYAIREFLESDGIGGGFGPGTALVTSDDAPSGDFVYKLVAVERDGTLEPSMKLSPGKVTYPSQKRVTRIENDGEPVADVIGLREESLPGEDLLQPVIEDGAVVATFDLEKARARALESVRSLPVPIRQIEDPASHEVRISDELEQQVASVQADLESMVDRD